MASGERRDFGKGAAQWDEEPARVQIAADVAAAVMGEINLTNNMAALDFGCGTGLVTLNLQPFVGSIVGVDSSRGMLAVLEQKIAAYGLQNVKTFFADFEKGDAIEGRYDLIVCSMTMHHIPDTAALLRLWHNLLLPGGHLCVADLDAEDGSFHSDMTGVFHLGFDRTALIKTMEDIGFRNARHTTAGIREREIKGGGKRAFPIFLITAQR